MYGDGWDNLIFDDWLDYDMYVDAHGAPKQDVIIGGLPYRYVGEED